MDGVKLPHDIEGSIAAAGGDSSGWLWLAVVVGALILAIIAFLLWWRRRRTPPAVVESAKSAVLRRIRNLMPPPAGNMQAQREWSAELSLLIRIATEVRWELPATDRTNEELRPMLREHGSIPRETSDQLVDILSQLDLVQFADQHLEPVRAGELQQRALAIAENVLEPVP